MTTSQTIIVAVLLVALVPVLALAWMVATLLGARISPLLGLAVLAAPVIAFALIDQRRKRPNRKHRA